MGTIIKQTTYATLPTGDYPARIEAADLEEGQFGQQVKFIFAVETPDGETASLFAWSSAKFSPSSKLYGWARAAFGRDIAPDYDLDLDHLRGRRVLLTVVVRTKEDGTEYNKVDAVRALRLNGAPLAASAPPAAYAPARRPFEDEVPF